MTYKDRTLTDADKILEDIDAGYGVRKEETRRYIGASSIGNRCDALLALSLRGFSNDSPFPRLQRIFALGHVIEDVVVRDLKKRAKIPVMENNPMTGKQWNYQELGGHIRCNLDGLIELDDGRLRNLEVKSMNDNSFEKFKDMGVKISHAHYYDQMQMQMAMSKTRDTLFIAYNKNNSDYHAEIVKFNDMDWEFLKSRIERALSNQSARISADEADWRCRGCFKRSACWDHTAPTVKLGDEGCHFCAHAVPVDGQEWHCTKHDREAEHVCSDYEQYRPNPKE